MNDKEYWVNLLFEVQTGKRSCRNAADIIMEAINKENEMTFGQENLVDPTWQKNNMEYDLRTCEPILKKVRASDTYAQNLYAAMCNMQFQQIEVWPILKNERWSCSWRHAGGIIADMREQGDYIDWYCSGIGEGLGNGDADGVKNYVSEGVVTEEIKADLKELGWIPMEWKDDEK